MKRSKRKILGQHFLFDKNLLEKIVSIINPEEKEIILEVGPGKGSLTESLVKRANFVYAVEIDLHLASELKKRNLKNLKVINQDILKIDLKKFFEDNKIKKEIAVVGNLPFSISSQILFWVIKYKDLISRTVFLLQKEFAEKILSKHRSKKYSPISVLFQIYFNPKIHFKISPHSFSPAPKVESCLVELIKRDKPRYEIGNLDFFNEFLHKIFRFRRKTVENNLKLAGLRIEDIRDTLKKSKIERQERAEELPMDKIYALWKNSKKLFDLNSSL